MEHSKTAIADCLIDNDRVRVTQYRFSPGSETKWHLHEWDYVVIPQTDGELSVSYTHLTLPTSDLV